jgi:hypothetical protein
MLSLKIKFLRQPRFDIHMMETADKLGVDVELFHRVLCCDRDAYFTEFAPPG